MKKKNPLREEIKNLSSVLNEENTKKYDMDKLLSSGDARTVYEAGRDWPKGTFDYKRGLEAIIEKSYNGDFIYYAGKFWPKGTFDFKRGFEGLLEKDYNGKGIESAGREWDEFDYKRGLDALIEKDRYGESILHAGASWLIFNFDKGLEYLIKKDKTGRFIYLAGKKNWRRFDYDKAFRALRKINVKTQGEGVYYDDALDDWPKEEVDKERERIENSSYNYIPFTKALQSLEKKEKKIKKKHPLREEVEDLSKSIKKQNIDDFFKTRDASDISYAGAEENPWFDYKRGFEAIIEKSNDGYEIMIAGEKWPRGKFDYAKGLDALIEKDKKGNWLYYAGASWPVFNFSKALHYLIKKDKGGKFIYDAGNNWRRFEYRKGFRALKTIQAKKGSVGGDYLYKAYAYWPTEEVEKEKKRQGDNGSFINGNIPRITRVEQLKRKEEKMKKKNPLREGILQRMID